MSIPFPIARKEPLQRCDVVLRGRREHRAILAIATLALVVVIATGCVGEPAVSGQEGGAAAPSAVIGAIGAAQQGDGLEVSIDTLRTADKHEMLDLDPSTTEIDTAELEPGYEFLVVGVTIENAGTAPHEYNAFSWSAKTPGNETPYPAALLAVTGYDLTAGDLDPNEDRSGEVVIAIPADATQLTLSYDTRLFNSEGTRLSWDVTVP